MSQKLSDNCSKIFEETNVRFVIREKVPQPGRCHGIRTQKCSNKFRFFVLPKAFLLNRKRFFFLVSHWRELLKCSYMVHFKILPVIMMKLSHLLKTHDDFNFTQSNIKNVFTIDENVFNTLHLLLLVKPLSNILIIYYSLKS